MGVAGQLGVVAAARGGRIGQLADREVFTVAFAHSRLDAGEDLLGAWALFGLGSPDVFAFPARGRGRGAFDVQLACSAGPGERRVAPAAAEIPGRGENG